MIANPRQTKATHEGGFYLFGKRSPYFPNSWGVKKNTMLLKAFVTNYSINSSNIELGVYFTSDNGTVNAGTNLSVPFSYSDTDLTIQAAADGVINTFCSMASLPVPTIDWMSTTPTDLAAAIAAAIPPAPASYQTIITQTGTSAPTAGITPLSTYAGSPTFTWARTGAGVYTLTASSAVFSTTKTAFVLGPLNNLNGQYTAVVTSSTVITITTAVQSLAVLGLVGFTATPTDAMMTKMVVQVLTYA